MGTTQPIRSMKKLELFESYYRDVKINKRNYVLIIMGLNTALRISDILNLTYGDVYDFDYGKIRKHIIIKEQKTKKTNQIYINPKVKNIISELLSYAVRYKDEWIFGSSMYKSNHLSRYQAYRIIREAANYARLGNDISCHSLRKTFGYHAWKQGTSPVLLMNIYNHSSFQVTKRYLGIEQDDKDEVFEQITL